MTEFRSKGKGKKRRVYAISEEHGTRTAMSRSRESQLRGKPGSVREYLYDRYGPEAFYESGPLKGKIKLASLDHAIYEADRDGRPATRKKLEATQRLLAHHYSRMADRLDREDEEHETYVKTHESHSRTGSVEHVEGHEMRLPSYEGGGTTKLSTEDRHKLPSSAFAEPGRRAYPIPSARQLEESLGWSREKARKGAERHAINALARVEQHGNKAEKEAVLRKIRENVPEVKGATREKGFTPTRKGETHVEAHEQPRYWVPAHESHSRDGSIEDVEGHWVEAHEVAGYEEEFNRPI